jgi:hypothetical protein
METIIQLSVFLGALWIIFAYKEKIRKWLLGDLELRTLRTYLIVLIKNTPDNIETILITYDDYKKLWGNGYVDLMYQKRKEKYLDNGKN